MLAKHIVYFQMKKKSFHYGECIVFVMDTGWNKKLTLILQ